MTDAAMMPPNGTSNDRGKPRIALMGEFSAGKSTLSNLLLGIKALPEKVTATRLAPVWISYGNTPPYREEIDGTQTNISLDRLSEVPIENTRVIRVFVKADILEICDLIDFPGISDPNMSPEVWQRMLSEVDGVIWCTHATQAWRQSEAAVWDLLPDAVRDNSILLITRFDKLITENDRQRVLRRVKHETKGLFAATFPISLTDALAAGDDFDAWSRSGAGEFTNRFIDLILDVEKGAKGHNPGQIEARAPSGRQTRPPPSGQTRPPPSGQTRPPPSSQTRPPPSSQTRPPPSDQTRPPPNETPPPPVRQNARPIVPRRVKRKQEQAGQ